MKKVYELRNIDSLDITDLLFKVEKSFDITFANNELMHISNFGEFCDHITNKIELVNSEDCTSQQAFYKLRNAISTTLQIDSKIITTDLLISRILSKNNRRLKIAEIENHLGFQLNLLRPPHWVTTTLFIIFLMSFVGLFFDWKYTLLGLIISLGGFRIANKFGNEFDVPTIGSLVQKMARENYLKSRRDSDTINKKEIEKLLIEWFSLELGIDRVALTREAAFV